MLVAGLRDFTGKIPHAYAGEQEFFLTSLNNMSQHIYDLQKGTLKELCDGFVLKLDAGKATLSAVNQFKAGLDSLISAADFRAVSGSMAGSNDLIKKRLGALKPVSRVDEGNKAAGGDPDALRHIAETYGLLHFEALAKRMKADPDELSVNAVLARAREEVAEYCCLYRVPLNEAETLTPFSLSCVDAALAASFRLLNGIYQPAEQETLLTS